MKNRAPEAPSQAIDSHQPKLAGPSQEQAVDEMKAIDLSLYEAITDEKVRQFTEKIIGACQTNEQLLAFMRVDAEDFDFIYSLSVSILTDQEWNWENCSFKMFA